MFYGKHSSTACAKPETEALRFGPGGSWHRGGTSTGFRAVGVVLCLAAGGSSSFAWSWGPASKYAPKSTLFQARGVATVEFGEQFAAPRAPAALQASYGVIRYRDNLDPVRNYDIFFSLPRAMSAGFMPTTAWTAT